MPGEVSGRQFVKKKKRRKTQQQACGQRAKGLSLWSYTTVKSHV